jgi:hypothetical protein
VGSTGSGKTIFVNACLDALASLAPHDRVISIEDTTELQCPVENYLDQGRSNSKWRIKSALQLTGSGLPLSTLSNTALSQTNFVMLGCSCSTRWRGSKTWIAAFKSARASAAALSVRAER